MPRPFNVLVATLVLVTAGCGQTGALYLPDDEPPQQSEPATDEEDENGAE